MKVLQIGVGRWGRNHVRAWRALGVDLQLCDSDASLLEGFEEPTSTDAFAALETVDAVDIATPAPSHAKLASAALELGKDVFVEKPLTDDSVSAFELAEEATRRGAILQVGHIFRFAPAIQAATSLLREGRIGEPHLAVAEFASFKRPRSDGGAAISDGIHLVDLTSWLLGRQPVAVQAALRDTLGRGLDDVAFLALDYGDTLVHVQTSFFHPRPRRGIELVGSEGALRCDLLEDPAAVELFVQRHRRGEDGQWTAESDPPERIARPEEEPLRSELQAFVAACQTRRPSAIAADGYAGACAVRVIERAQQAAGSGATLAIDLPEAPAS